jgi:hypothetical protein
VDAHIAILNAIVSRRLAIKTMIASPVTSLLLHIARPRHCLLHPRGVLTARFSEPRCRHAKTLRQPKGFPLFDRTRLLVVSQQNKPGAGPAADFENP